MEKLSLFEIAIADVAPYPRNARTHSNAQIDQIKKSIRAFGFSNPILVDENNQLKAGHGRLMAAKSLGLTQVPAILIAHLNEPKKRALRLADNKIALNAGWDLEILGTELADLSEMDLDFDIGDIGFEVAELDLSIGNAPMEDLPSETAPEPDRSVPLVTRRGDLWLLGPHRVICGSARSSVDLNLLMGARLADMGFTDPPYNVPIAGHVSGNGRVKHREFAEASGEMSSTVFEAFLAEALRLGAFHSQDGAVWFVFMDWRHIGELHRAGEEVFDACLNVCVWTKTNGGMGSLYRSQHELVFVFRKGQAQHRNNVQLGKFGRNRTNVWRYPGVNTFRPGRLEELTAHPTAKPVALVQDAILDVTAPGDIVLDPFLGAGSTLIAAERAGRILCGVEIDPAYVDVVLRRWREETGNEPVRERDMRSFVNIENQKNREAG